MDEVEEEDEVSDPEVYEVFLQSMRKSSPSLTLSFQKALSVLRYNLKSSNMKIMKINK